MKAIPAAACLAGLALASPASLAYADSPVVLDGADDDVRDAIEKLLPDRDAPTTLFDAERIAEEAADRATAYLRSEGYYQGEAAPAAQDNPPRARVFLTLGPRFTINEPSVTYEGSAPDDAAQIAVDKALALAPEGAPARAADVLAAEAAAVSSLQNAGYADAKAADRIVIVDHAAGTLGPTYNLEPGELVRLGRLRADPDGVLKDGFLEDVRNWELGAQYTPEALSTLRRDINATGSISRASTRLEPQAGSDGVRDVVLEVTPARRNSYELGVGFSTTEGLGVEAEWARRNYTRRADTLTLSGTLSELAQSAEVEWKLPHAAGRGQTVRFTADISREDTEPYVRQGVSIAAAVEAQRRLRYGLSYGASLSADQYEDAGTAAVSDAIVLSTFGEVRRDTTGNPLDARNGDIVEVRVEPSVSTGDATLAFVRTTAEGRIYRSFGPEGDQNLTLAARARAGWITALAGSNDDLPPDRRFYAGGGGSVRGYDYNSIYPEERKAPDAVPGGQGLFEVSAEARWRFLDTFGAVAFIDGGNAFDEWGEATDLKWGAGIGARYDLGFAPLRVDLAVPLDKQEGDADYALYVSIGQAF